MPRAEERALLASVTREHSSDSADSAMQRQGGNYEQTTASWSDQNPAAICKVPVLCQY